MKIAIIAVTYSAEYSWHLAHALCTQGHEVLMMATRHTLEGELGKDHGPLPAGGKLVTVEHRQLRDPRFLATVFTLVREVTRFAPDVIHVHEALIDYLFAAFPFFRRAAPVVMTVHDHLPHSGFDAQIKSRAHTFRRVMRRAAAAIIVHGEMIRTEMRKLGHHPRASIWVVPHGVLGPEPVKPQEREAGRILFFGRIEAYKGLGVLVEAVRMLQSEGIRAHLTIAGNGTDLDRHRAAIASLEGCELIDRFIRVDEIAPLFQRASVVALPYLDGTQSGVAAMAARYGRPVVATAVGSIPEMVRHGSSGLVVAPGDPVALAGALREVLNDEGVARALCEGAERMRRTELSWEWIARKTLEVYTAAIEVCSATPTRGKAAEKRIGS